MPSDLLSSGPHELSLALSNHLEETRMPYPDGAGSNATNSNQDPRTRSLAFIFKILLAGSTSALIIHKDMLSLDEAKQLGL